MNNRLIYLDNKIHGAIDQLVKYFDDEVFDKETTTVLFKIYPKSYLYYKSVLEKNNIKYSTFKKFSKINLSKFNFVYYLFNAQSNCRIVSNRKLKHIFVTHGESNKLASIKPIIRIYDHVICSGQISLDRYFQSGLFNIHDIESKRLIMMGDTFIGQVNYFKELDIEKSWILYAPTWEGGLEDENYSSLTKDLKSFNYLIKYANKYNIKRIIIQPHPNTGHRNEKYQTYLEKGIGLLVKNGLSVGIYNSSKKIPLSKIYKLKNLFNKKYTLLNTNEKYGIHRSFVDISAMEMQLINKDIDTNVFLNNCSNSIPKNDILLSYYKKSFIYLSTKLMDIPINDCLIKDYLIDYSDKNIIDKSFKERIEWLENTI